MRRMLVILTCLVALVMFGEGLLESGLRYDIASDDNGNTIRGVFYTEEAITRKERRFFIVLARFPNRRTDYAFLLLLKGNGEDYLWSTLKVEMEGESFRLAKLAAAYEITTGIAEYVAWIFKEPEKFFSKVLSSSCEYVTLKVCLKPEETIHIRKKDFEEFLNAYKIWARTLFGE